MRLVNQENDMHGVIRFYNGRFGIIADQDGTDAAYLHASQVSRAGLDNLEAGARVRFETRPDNRGGKLPFAINIAAL